jgi:hypothetical protein
MLQQELQECGKQEQRKRENATDEVKANVQEDVRRHVCDNCGQVFDCAGGALAHPMLCKCQWTQPGGDVEEEGGAEAYLRVYFFCSRECFQEDLQPLSLA